MLLNEMENQLGKISTNMADGKTQPFRSEANVSDKDLATTLSRNLILSQMRENPLEPGPSTLILK